MVGGLQIHKPMSKQPQVESPVQEAKTTAGGTIATPEYRSPAEFQYCIFRTGREHYCVSVLEVEEVVECPELSRVPLAPPFLLGIFSLRGVIVPVLDIAYRENLVARWEPTHLVVAAWHGPAERDTLRWAWQPTKCSAPA